MGSTTAMLCWPLKAANGWAIKLCVTPLACLKNPCCDMSCPCCQDIDWFVDSRNIPLLSIQNTSGENGAEPALTVFSIEITCDELPFDAMPLSAADSSDFSTLARLTSVEIAAPLTLSTSCCRKVCEAASFIWLSALSCAM